MGLIYRRKQPINGYECTPDFKVQPTAVMNYFQQVSQEQSEALGVGAKKLDDMAVAWFLVKYDIHFHAYPICGQSVDVETEALAFDKFAARRRFAICDEEGKPMIEADTEWMLLNRRENKVERLDGSDFAEVYGVRQGARFKMPKLAKVSTWESEKTFQVRYLDIDHNGHVNHVKYLAWAIESLPIDRVTTTSLSEARIIFKNQCFYGDLATVHAAQIDVNTFRMDITNQEGVLLSQIELILEERRDV